MVIEFIRGETNDVMIQVEMPAPPETLSTIGCRGIDWVVYSTRFVYCSRGGIGGQHIGACARRQGPGRAALAAADRGRTGESTMTDNDLERLVELHVFGRHTRDDCPECGFRGQQATPDAEDVSCSACGATYLPLRSYETGLQTARRFLSDWNATMLIVERLRAEGWNWSLHRAAEVDIVCRFWKADDVYRRTLRSAGHPTDGRRSIVLAALRAKGVEVE